VFKDGVAGPRINLPRPNSGRSALLPDKSGRTLLRFRQGHQQCRDELSEIVDVVRCAPKHNHGERETRQFLLFGEVLIDRQKNIEATGGLGEQITVSQSSPTHLLDRTGIVPDEVAAQLLRHALIEEDAHEGSILGYRKKPFPSLSKQLMHLRFRDRRKIREKIRDGMTAIQVIEQRLDGDTGPDKARRPAHDLGVHGDDAGFHADKLAGGPFPARFDSPGGMTRRDS